MPLNYVFVYFLSISRYVVYVWDALAPTNFDQFENSFFLFDALWTPLMVSKTKFRLHARYLEKTLGVGKI